MVNGVRFCSTLLNAASGTGLELAVVDVDEPPPPPPEELLPADEDVLDVPLVLVVFVPEMVVVALVDADCSTVLPAVCVPDVVLLLNCEAADVVVRPELLDVTALTPDVELAVNCEVPEDELPDDEPLEDVDELVLPCR